MRSVQKHQSEAVLRGIDWSFLAGLDALRALKLFYRLLRNVADFEPATREALLEALEQTRLGVVETFARGAGQDLMRTLETETLGSEELRPLLAKISEASSWTIDDAFDLFGSLVAGESTRRWARRLVWFLPGLHGISPERSLSLSRTLVDHPEAAIRLETFGFLLGRQRFSGEDVLPLIESGLSQAFDPPDPLFLNSLVQRVDLEHLDVSQVTSSLARLLANAARYEPLARLLDRLAQARPELFAITLTAGLEEGLLETPEPGKLRELYGIRPFKQRLLQDVWAHEGYFFSRILEHLFGALAMQWPEGPEPASKGKLLSMASTTLTRIQATQSVLDHIGQPSVVRQLLRAAEVLEEGQGEPARGLSRVLYSLLDLGFNRIIWRDERARLRHEAHQEVARSRRQLKKLVSRFELVEAPAEPAVMEALKVMIPAATRGWRGPLAPSDQEPQETLPLDNEPIQVHLAQALELLLTWLADPPDQLSLSVAEEMVRFWLDEETALPRQEIGSGLIAALAAVAQRLPAKDCKEIRHRALLEVATCLRRHLDLARPDLDLKFLGQEGLERPPLASWILELGFDFFRELAKIGSTEAIGLLEDLAYVVGQMVTLSREHSRRPWKDFATFGATEDFWRAVAEVEDQPSFHQLCEDFVVQRDRRPPTQPWRLLP